MIVTDSFHGCMFSIIFKKQFAFFRREGYYNDMFDRIKTLLKMTGLEDQIINELPEEYKRISDEKYIQVEEILDAKRQEAVTILKSVLV